MVRSVVYQKRAGGERTVCLCTVVVSDAASEGSNFRRQLYKLKVDKK